MSARKPARPDMAMAHEFLLGASVRCIAEAWNKHPQIVEQALRSALVLRLRGVESNRKLPANSARAPAKKGAGR